jgi:murein DD-endopeptidase MepM/ murein hydrolase activator NlpD
VPDSTTGPSTTGPSVTGPSVTTPSVTTPSVAGAVAPDVAPAPGVTASATVPAPRTRREARRASSEVVTAPAGVPVSVEITVETTPIPDARSAAAPSAEPPGTAPSAAPAPGAVAPADVHGQTDAAPRRGRRAAAYRPSADAPAEREPVIAPDPVATAAAPSVPRGRRAAASFSDNIERPATGRRAIVPVATTVLPVITAESGQAPVVEPEADESATPEAAPTAPSVPVVPVTPAAPAVIERPATGRRARVSVATSAVVVPPDVAPPAKQVSRRTLCTAPVQGFDAPTSGASGSGRPGADQADPAGSTTGAADAARADGTDGETPQPGRRSARRRRRGDIAKGTFSIVALLFATGIAVATTMPATALHSASVATGSAGAGAVGAGVDAAGLVVADIAPLPVQEHTTGPAAAGSGVARDDYSVRDISALKAAGMRVADTFTNDPAGAIQWPFPVGVPISSGFGPRESPGGIGSTDHKGVDFTPGQGTPISSIADGVVSTVVTSDNGGLGIYVIVDHVIDGMPVSSVYGHMLAGSPEVTEGQLVTVGQPLGRVGNTGTSTGAHLHLEIRLAGTPTDPYAWLTTHTA